MHPGSLAAIALSQNSAARYIYTKSGANGADGMEAALQWVLVFLLLSCYGTLLGSLLLWKRTRALIVGYSGHRACGDEEPVYLPYAAAGWAVATATALALLRPALMAEVEATVAALPLLSADIWGVPPAPAAPAAPPAPTRGMLGSAAHPFFSLGWNEGLAVFGIAIDRWNRYAAVCMYQMTRAVFGSLVSNVFIPFVNTTISNSTPPRLVPPRTARRALVGKAMVAVFTTWSAMTDVLMSARQIDLALFTLVATQAADFMYGYYRIRACNSEAGQEGGSSPAPAESRSLSTRVVHDPGAGDATVTRVGIAGHVASGRRRGGGRYYGVSLLADP